MKLYFASLLLAGANAVTNMSGEIKTTETFQYGKFITRMKSEDKYGTVASFFTYWIGPNWQVGEWNEIDVEIVPSMSLSGQSDFSTNIIYGGGDGTGYNIEE